MAIAETLLVSAHTDFDRMLAQVGAETLPRQLVEVLQANLGRLCNQACVHCHVDAGLSYAAETMSEEVARGCLGFLAKTPSIHTLELTGGAPELAPCFRLLVRGARRLGRKICVRTNLTVLLEPGQHDMARFFARNQIEILASLPGYLEQEVDSQRGVGTFQKSIAALRMLNCLGYARNPKLCLNLAYNPAGTSLSGSCEALEAEFRSQLLERHGIVFNRFFAFTNMPIRRFERLLRSSGQYERYLAKLVHAFDPAALQSLACRNCVSVSPDGRLYDCDFNQALSLAVRLGGKPLDVRTASVSELLAAPIHFARHCFGCTARADRCSCAPDSAGA